MSGEISHYTFVLIWKFCASIIQHLVSVYIEICTNKYTSKQLLQLTFTDGTVQYENKTTMCNMKICPKMHA